MTMVKTTTLRFPDDIKAFIEAEARQNASTQNSEIVRCIRERMKAEDAVGTAIPPRHVHANPVEGKDNEYYG